MTLHPLEENVATALAKAIGHEPGFEDRELAGVKHLVVRHAYSIDDIAYCENLETLSLVGCEIHDLEPIRSLSRLIVLSVEYSALRELGAVTGMTQVLDLNLKCNDIEDITPLLSLPRLTALSLVGNPLSPHSYHELLPKIPLAVEPPYLPGEMEYSDEEVWRLTTELRRRNMPACYYRTDDQYYLCIPGLRYTPRPEIGHARLDPDQLRSELADPNAELMSIYRKYQP